MTSKPVKKYRGHYNLAGERFGKLIVIEKLNRRYISPGGKKHILWKCKCDCGEETTLTTNVLCMNRTRSCGCMFLTEEGIKRRANGNIKERAGAVELFGSYKRNAKKRNHKFELTLEECEILFTGKCHYCNVEPSMVMLKSAIPYTYNGIDRKDNTLGYTKENSLSCCKVCNRAKVDLPYDVFLSKVEDIYNYRIKNAKK